MDVQQFNKIKQLSRNWDSIKKNLKSLEKSNNNDFDSAILFISKSIESELASLKSLYTKAKEELIKNGYQSRFCWVEGKLEFYQDNEICSMVLDSSDFKCLICHESVPEIKGVRVEVKKDYTLTNNSLIDIRVHILCDQIIDKSFVIGHGDCEELAWDMAIQNFSDNNA